MPTNWAKMIRAHEVAVVAMEKDPVLEAVNQSGYFTFPGGQERGHRVGLQVFVRVCRYSEDLARDEPETGGLLVNRKARRGRGIKATPVKPL